MASLAEFSTRPVQEGNGGFFTDFRRQTIKISGFWKGLCQFATTIFIRRFSFLLERHLDASHPLYFPNRLQNPDVSYFIGDHKHRVYLTRHLYSLMQTGQAFRVWLRASILSIMMKRTVTDLRTQAGTLKRWPSGKIRIAGGKLVDIRCGIVARRSSVARVWLETRFRSQPPDQCILHYHSPLLSRYLSLDLVLAGPQTRLSTIRGACEILDEVARIRGSVAIFAHVSTARISDRLLQRLGWQRHLLDESGRHWMKRFYDGYPDHDRQRYVPEPGKYDQHDLRLTP